MNTHDSDRRTAQEGGDTTAQPLTDEKRANLLKRFRRNSAAISGSLQKGQSWEDFKAGLKAALTRNGIIEDDGESDQQKE